MKNTLYRTLAAILFAAIVAAIGRMFKKTDSPTMQHTSINTHANYPMHIDSTANLILYDITDCRLDLACGMMPDSTDEMVIFCAAAAFTRQCLDTFEHSNILGPHVSNGKRFEGYIEHKDGIPFHQRYALFVWKGIDVNGKMLGKGIADLPADQLLLQAIEQGGMAFTQHWVIKNGEIFTPHIQPLERVEYYRTICVKQNRVYVIANREEVTYHQYLNFLVEFGVDNALYMDMGAGWNHSFYRDSSNVLHILHPKTHSYPTNWLVVYK